MALDKIPGPQIFIQRDVRRNAIASVTVAQQLSPIGSIVAWAKTLSGVPALPAGWIQCDGQILSDVDSLLDGTTIPDLNGGNRFLRGNAASGGTGGSETMNHTHSISNDGQSAAGGAAYYALNAATTNSQSSSENRPPFYTVVWIMRIK